MVASIASRDDRPSATHELRLRPGRAARSAGIVWCDTSSSATRAERARVDRINIILVAALSIIRGVRQDIDVR